MKRADTPAWARHSWSCRLDGRGIPHAIACPHRVEDLLPPLRRGMGMGQWVWGTEDHWKTRYAAAGIILGEFSRSILAVFWHYSGSNLGVFLDFSGSNLGLFRPRRDGRRGLPRCLCQVVSILPLGSPSWNRQPELATGIGNRNRQPESGNWNRTGRPMESARIGNRNRQPESGHWIRTRTNRTGIGNMGRKTIYNRPNHCCWPWVMAGFAAFLAPLSPRPSQKHDFLRN